VDPSGGTAAVRADPAMGHDAAMGEATVRAMRESDLDGALDMFAAVAAEVLWLGTEPGFDRERRREAWLAGLSDPRSRSVVVEAGGRLLGNGSVTVARYGVAEVGMALAADARGRGLGARLLDVLVEAAAGLGAHKVGLQVWPHNERAIRLYLSRGFLVEGRLRSHYRRSSGQAWDSIVMGLVLPASPAAPPASGPGDGGAEGSGSHWSGLAGSGLADAPSLPEWLDLRA
jgi:RimJ/RimL family protein N-acetyltransferase